MNELIEHAQSLIFLARENLIKLSRFRHEIENGERKRRGNHDFEIETNRSLIEKGIFRAAPKSLLRVAAGRNIGLSKCKTVRGRNLIEVIGGSHNYRVDIIHTVTKRDDCP